MAIRSPMHVFTAKWKFEAYMRFVAKEMSFENLIFFAEWLAIKNVMLIHNPILKTKDHLESYPNLHYAPIKYIQHVQDKKESEEKKLELDPETEEDDYLYNIPKTETDGDMPDMISSIMKLRQEIGQKSNKSRCCIQIHQCKLCCCCKQIRKKLSSVLMNIDTYRNKYFEKIYREKNDDNKNTNVSTNISFEWDDKWFKWIENNCLTNDYSNIQGRHFNFKEYFKAMDENLQRLKKHKYKLNQFSSVFKSLHDRYFAFDAMLCLNISHINRVKSTKLTQTNVNSNTTITNKMNSKELGLEMLCLLSDCANEIYYLAFGGSWKRFQRSAEWISAIAINDADERYIFKLWRRKQESRKREMKEKLEMIQHQIRYKLKGAS